MRFSYLVLFTLLVFILVGSATAEGPRKVGEIYTTEVVVVGAEHGEVTEVVVPAQLTVLGAGDREEAVSTATLEVDIPPSAVLITVPRSSLPPQYQRLLGEEDSRSFARGADGWGSSISAPHGPGMRASRLQLAGAADGTTSSPTRIDAVVLDASGKPASGMRVEVTAQLRPLGEPVHYPILSTTLANDGRVRFSLPRLSGRELPQNYYDTNILQHRITVTDPFNGQKQQILLTQNRTGVFLGYMATGAAGLTEIATALVPTASNAAAFRGKVVQNDGTPVGNMSLGLSWLATPGLGGHQFHQMPVVHTGPDGSFCLAPPADFLEKATGQPLVPQKSRLTVTVGGVVQAELTAEKENIVELPYTETLVFELRDQNDQPIAGIGKFIREGGGYELIRTDETSGPIRPELRRATEVLDEGSARVRIGSVPLPGTYQLRRSLDGTAFAPQRLERGASGSTIVWRPGSDGPVLVGRVVAAETSAPIAGAFLVSAVEQTAAWALANMDPVYREHVWRTWSEGKKEQVLENDAIRSAKGLRIWRPIALARTGSDGAFRLEFPPGQQASHVQVYAPGRLAARGELHSLRPQPDLTRGIIRLADLALPLAAYTTVTVQAPPLIPDPFLRSNSGDENSPKGISISVSFDRDGWKAVVPGLNPQGNSPWRLVDSNDWGSFGNPNLVHVPAGVKVSLHASSPYSPTLGFASWKDVGPFAAGTCTELPPVEMTIKRPFLVTVRNADGTPAPGISLRIDGQVPLTTDAQGTAIGWAPGHVERLEAYIGSGWEVAAKKTHFDVPESTGGVPFKVELTLPAK